MKRLLMFLIISLLFVTTSYSASLQVTVPVNSEEEGVVKYTVYMKSDNSDGSGFVKGQDIAGTIEVSDPDATSLITIVGDLADSSNYAVRITATNAGGYESEFSAASFTGLVDFTPPGQPANPYIIIDSTAKTLTVGWEASSSKDVKYYYLYSSTTQGSGYRLIARKGKTYRSIKFTGISADTFWVLTSVDVAGNESVRSDEISNVWYNTFYRIYGSKLPQYMRYKFNAGTVSYP